MQRYKWHFNICRNINSEPARQTRKLKQNQWIELKSHRETWAESLNRAQKSSRNLDRIIESINKIIARLEQTYGIELRSHRENLSRIIESSSEFIAKAWAELLNRSYRRHRETWAESLSHRENLNIFMESSSEVIAKTWAELLYRAQKSSRKLEQNYWIHLLNTREN